MTLLLDQIQGNITPGFRKDHQAFLFFQFPGDMEVTRAWIREIRPYIASAEEVATFNQLFRLVKTRLKGHEWEALRATWVNVGFSAPGMKKLIDAAAYDKFPADFKDPPESRRTKIDTPEVRATFEFGGSIDTVPDAIVIIGADTCDDLKAAINRQTDLAKFLKPIGKSPYIGKTLGERKEHFGFRDGISQPDPDDPLKGWVSDEGVPPVVAPGEFILGLAREPRPGVADADAVRWPKIAKHGSYLVFRKFLQNVAAFEAEVEQAKDEIDKVYIDPPVSPEDGPRQKLLKGITLNQARAKLMGRWPSGHKLTGDQPPLLDNDPGAQYASIDDEPNRLKYIDPQEFKDDLLGDKCPLFAHIRKAHPRGAPGANLHRIIRRGITFGPWAKNRKNDDHKDRGIYFLAYQASIGEQFEFIQSRWLDKRGPAERPLTGDGLGAGVHLSTAGVPPGLDPVGGARTSSISLDDRHISPHFWEGGNYKEIDFPTRVGKDQPILPMATGNFFIPSIPAVEQLGK